MPELPEVETTRQGIRPHIIQQRVNKVIVRRTDLRWPVTESMSRLLCGNVVRAVKRRGKYLLLEFDNGTALIHLGMSGSIAILEIDTQAEKHDHFDMHFSNMKILRYTDPRRFGAFLWAGVNPLQHKLLVNLGVEPLEETFNAEYIYKASKKTTIAVKQFIMNARLVVGVGNIYANEVLFLAGIHPARGAHRISFIRYQQLVRIIKEVLNKAVRQGGTTLKDFTQVDGKPGYFTQSLNVYGRTGQECRVCKEILLDIRQSGRTSVFCNKCQK